ncbi:MAG: hypothetical protein GKR88_10070 [Flavobacteriaceae bacterium]|nr:MAG: hypothetical protein GKR88_10070 [Flavobacteriaceae bacterium]
MQIYTFALIDFIKILVKSPKIEHLYSNPKLTFFRKESRHTGEYKTKEVADYHFCKVIIYENGTVLFKGSIHKFWNSLNQCIAPNFKMHNYTGYNGNLFTLKNVNEVFKHLEKLFGCKLQQMLIRSIEFGINSDVNFNPNKFLTGLLFHIGKPFESQYNRTYFEAIHQKYKIKIYNKSYQFKMPNNVLRFEIKYFKMCELKKIGIYTLQDINSKTILEVCSIILKRFDEVIYFDKSISKKQLTKNEKELSKNYSNINYWIDDLKAIHRHRHKKRLKELIAKHSKNLHQQIKEDLLKKCVIINQVTKDGFV